MLYVVYENGSTQTHHVGEELILIQNILRVAEVQADGDELQDIYSQYGTGIPQAGNKVTRWFGDTAKFIIANLKL